jgi:predicted nucleotidyltransferase
MDILTKILSSKVRAELFRLLFGTQTEELHMRELQRGAGCSIGPIQTELRKLLDLQLVIARRSGNRLYYKANIQHPLYPEINMLVLKTNGLADYLKKLLQNRDDITAAFIFGSLASGSEKAASDIDLMFIGTAGLRAISGLLSDFKAKVGRDVNPHVFAKDEFIKRKLESEHFIASVLTSPKIFVKGTEHDLAEMG